MTGDVKLSPRAQAQLDQIDAGRRAQARTDRTNRIAYAEVQARRVAAGRDARDDVRRAHLGVESAEDAFSRVAVSECLDGGASEDQLTAAWRGVDAARMRLAAAHAVAAALGGLDVA